MRGSHHFVNRAGHTPIRCCCCLERSCLSEQCCYAHGSNNLSASDGYRMYGPQSIPHLKPFELQKSDKAYEALGNTLQTQSEGSLAVV